MSEVTFHPLVVVQDGPVDLSPALAESAWLDRFCLLVRTAYSEARECHESPPLSEVLRVQQRRSVGFTLKMLFDHIVGAWNRRNEGFVWVSSNPGPGIIDFRVWSAYVEAHEMFKKIERLQKEDPTMGILPLYSLERINGMLADVRVVVPAVDPRIDDPKTLADLAAIVRRDKPKQSPVARLLDLMHQESQVTFGQLREKVHLAEVDDDAVEAKIKAARKWISKYKMPIKLVVSDRHLSRRSG